MRVAVIGVGGVGGYTAAILARAGNDVHCIARGENLRAIQTRGLTVRDATGEWTVSVSASESGEGFAGEPNPELVIVAVKEYSLQSVSGLIADLARRGSVVLPLLNGIDISERLVASGVNAANVLGGLAQLSAQRIAPAKFERRSPFCRFILGERSGSDSRRTEAIAAALRTAGAEAEEVRDIQLKLWEKFIFICTVSAVCGLCRAPIGAVREREDGRQLLSQAVAEVVAVARANQIGLSATAELDALRQIEKLPSDMRPSLLLDLLAGRPTEVNALSGMVARLAARSHMHVPVHELATIAFTLQAGVEG